MMIKIINNIEHYSFFFMALANTDQPPALNNVHQTTPSGEVREGVRRGEGTAEAEVRSGSKGQGPGRGSTVVR